jgi:hypothetical protein
MPKPESYRAFFVARDPRDVVISHYFSSKFSHSENTGVLEERARVADLPEKEGIIVHMRYMGERGIFDALRSWVISSDNDSRIRVYRFEDLTGADQVRWVSDLMEHCDIRIPAENLKAILTRLSFENLSGGRKQGEENPHHKYRSGKHGSWRKYFDADVNREFAEVAGDLPRVLGYDD